MNDPQMAELAEQGSLEPKPPGNGTRHDFQVQRIRDLEAKCAELERQSSWQLGALTFCAGERDTLRSSLTAAEQRCAGLEKYAAAYLQQLIDDGVDYEEQANIEHALRTLSGEKGEAT